MWSTHNPVDHPVRLLVSSPPRVEHTAENNADRNVRQSTDGGGDTCPYFRRVNVERETKARCENQLHESGRESPGRTRRLPTLESKSE